tara:strand:+ start:2076 stop:2306 length:231 start_codon:yes stop_codon:yes gene_type:complete
MIAKAIMNPDSTIEVGTLIYGEREEDKKISFPTHPYAITCEKCQQLYNLPIGAYTFRCKMCGQFNNKQLERQCNIM